MEEKYAYFTMILATFLYALQPVVLKKTKGTFIYQIICLCLGLLIPSSLVILYYNSKLEPDKRFNFIDLIKNKNRLLYGILLTIFYFTCTHGFKELPITISLPIFMLFPVSLLITERIINKVQIQYTKIIGSIITIIGVITVCYSKVKVKLNPYSILIMIIGTFCFGTGYTLLKVEPERELLIEDSKKMIEYEDKLDSDFMKANIDLIQTSFIPLIFSVLILILIQNKSFKNVKKYLNNEKINLSSFLKLLIVSLILSYSYNLLYFESYNNMDPIIYGALENCEVIFSLFIGYFILNEQMNINKIMGTFLIIGGILFNIFSDKYTNDNDKHKIKR